jgi:hypothetical protein
MLAGAKNESSGCGIRGGPSVIASHRDLKPSLRAQAKQSSLTAAKLDCFVAEPVIGRRFAPTRWLLAMTAEANQ